MPEGKPNIVVIWGDDIKISNLSCYSDGLMGYRTPNIDRITMATKFLESFRQFPPRHPPASFSVDQVVEKLHEFLAKD